MERTITPRDLKSSLEEVSLIDIRRKADKDADDVRLPGAVWLDPEQISIWSTSLPKDKETILYCVRGGSVSNAVLDTLRAQGIAARFIEGGLVAWKESGGDVEAK